MVIYTLLTRTEYHNWKYIGWFIVILGALATLGLFYEANSYAPVLVQAGAQATTDSSSSLANAPIPSDGKWYQPLAHLTQFDRVVSGNFCYLLAASLYAGYIIGTVELILGVIKSRISTILFGLGLALILVDIYYLGNSQASMSGGLSFPSLTRVLFLLGILFGVLGNLVFYFTLFESFYNWGGNKLAAFGIVLFLVILITIAILGWVYSFWGVLGYFLYLK